MVADRTPAEDPVVVEPQPDPSPEPEPVVTPISIDHANYLGGTRSRTMLATLLLGYSHRFQDNRQVNLSVGAGLTRDTPDLTLTLRMPFSL